SKVQKSKSQVRPEKSKGRVAIKILKIAGCHNEAQDDDDDQENANKDDDEEGDDDDDQEEGSDDEQASDEEEEEFIHPSLSTHDEEETRDEESFDPVSKTPKNTDDVGNGEEDLGMNVGREEGQDEEDDMLNPNPDAGIESIFETSSQMDVQPQTTVAPLPLSAPTLTPSTIATTTTTLEVNFSEFMQTNQFAGVVSSILEIVQRYIDQRMNEAVKVAVHIQSDRLRDEAQAENEEFLKTIDENMNLYKALVEAYGSDKIILDTYGDTVTLKRRCDDDADKDEEPFAGSDRGSKRQRKGKEPESASALKEKATRSTGKSTQGELAKQTDSRSSFNELMDTPVDFSAFLMNQLKVDSLTPELLAGPTYELMKGSCKSLVELEFFLKEFYKATTNQLDWVNPERQQYPHNLLKPLPLIPNSRGRRVIPFDHFINNDLEYLRGGYEKHALWGISHWGRKRQQFYSFAVNRESAHDVYSKRRIIAVTELKIVEWHNYKHLDWIMVRRDDDKLYKFKEGDFKRLHIQDIKDMLLLLVQGKLTNLTVKERFAFNVSLRMFTRSIVIQRRTRPSTRCRKIPEEAQPYKAGYGPDGMLTDVRTALDDCLKGIRMKKLKDGVEGKAIEWLDIIPLTQITTWDQLISQFLDHFFPVRRTLAFRDLILRFKQRDDEPIKSVRIRFQDLIKQVPHHGIQKWLLVQIFHDNISRIDHRKLDQFTQFCFSSLTEEERWNRIKEYVQYQDDLWDDPSPSMNVSFVSEAMQPTLRGRLKRACKKISFLETPTQEVSLKNLYLICDYCGGTHEADECKQNNPSEQIKEAEKGCRGWRLFLIFKQIHINLPFLETMIHMPKGAKELKDLLSHNEKIKKAPPSMKLSEERSAIIQRSLPQKEGDPAGSESRPPILNKENYLPWLSRLLRYAKSRPNGKLIHNSILNGLYVRKIIPEPGDANHEITITETFHFQTDDKLSDKELKQIEADDQAIQTILLGLPKDIYAAVDSCETAQEIWLRVQQMMKGSGIGIQEKKAKLFNKWERFTSNEGESIESYYHRFLKLMNDLKRNKHFPEKIANEFKAERIAKTQDPLALMANSNNPYRISSNLRNRQIAQPGMNMGQDRQMQMVGGNGGNQFRQYTGQNAGTPAGYNDVIGNQNPIENGNLVIARAEGNAARQNRNQIMCYNYRGVGHYARNCTVRPRRRDAAYLQTQLLIAQKEEAGIQLQAEEYDLMAAAADLDEIKEVNANCILMANLQQASTSGTRTDSAPVYDTDGSAEVHENCDDNEIFNMFTQEEQ
nr:hypothetical protein [Tanacetum cinerariifolium]